MTDSQFPEDWIESPVLDLFYIKGRLGWKGLRASEFTYEGPYLVTGTDFDNGRINWNTCYHISSWRYTESPEIMVKNNDILITKDGTIGKVAFIDFLPAETTLNSHLFLVRRKNEKVIQKYAYYVFVSDHFRKYIESNQSGSTIGGLSQRVFEKFKIPLPSGYYQNKVAEILTNIDELITKTEALIHKYQRIKAGLMHDLFTRGLTADGKLRPPREQAPELYHETPIGWIPKEWEVQGLQDLCVHDITYGIVQAGPHVDGGVPYIRTGDMSGDSLAKNSLLCTSRLIADSYKRSEVKAGEIVCAIRATVGKVLIVPDELDGANLTQGTARISPKGSVYTPFVLWGFRSFTVQKEIELSIKGTTFNEITLRDLRFLKFPTPKCKNEQILISEKIETCEGRIRQEKSIQNKLQQMKQGLMHDLLTGKAQVTIDKEETTDH
jgi:type I restriction enzyme, S subunit